MGYEIRLHILETYNFKPLAKKKGQQDYVHGREIAMLNLCKIGEGSLMDLITKSHDAKLLKKYPHAMLYGTNDKKMVKDCYDEDLHAIPVKEFLQALKENMGDGEVYRRFISAKALLETLADETLYENIVVVPYGY